MRMAVRGSVAFQTRGNAINQQTRWDLGQGVEMKPAEKELVERRLPAHRALSHQVCRLTPRSWGNSWLASRMGARFVELLGSRLTRDGTC